MANNTFLGLQPYTEEDAYRFKGRTEESQKLFRLIVRNDFTVCYAESGEGKTSLLNAGVFPLLRQNMFFPIAITFTSDDYEHTPDSFDAIIDRCIKDSITEYNEKNKSINVEYKLCSTDFQSVGCQAELQQELSKYSWWKLRNYKPQAMGLSFTPVFIFDQFEEVFNLPGSIVWTKKFFDWLEEVSSDSCPDDIIKKVRSIIGDKAAFPTIKEEKDFKAVFSLRKEFIGELDYWGMQKCFIPSLKDNRYCLKALTYEGAKKVMTQQQRFEEAKVEQVLHYFVRQYSREPEKTIDEKLPVIPALLLSVVCDSWEKDIDFFSGKDENEIGQSLNKILERFYEEALSYITNEISQQKGNGQEDSIRANIETAIFALVDSNGKRVRRKSSELYQLDFDAKYKEILSDKRIIKISKVDGEDYVEIVHDALCPIIAKRKELYLAAEAKKREEESLLEQAKKNRKRMMLASTIALAIIGLLLFFLWQNDRYLKEQEARSQSENEKDIIQKSLNLSEAEKDYLQKQNDSISYLNRLNELQKDSLKRQKDELNQSLIKQQELTQSLQVKNSELEIKVNLIKKLQLDVEEQNSELVKQLNLIKKQKSEIQKKDSLIFENQELMRWYEEMYERAKLFFNQKEYAKANDCYELICIKIKGTEYESLIPKIRNCIAINNMYMGVAALKTKDYPTAKNYLGNAIKDAEPESKTYYMANSWMGQCYSIQALNISIDQGDYGLAIEFSREAERYFDMANAPEKRLREQLSRVSSLQELSRNDEAEVLLKKIMSECEGYRFIMGRAAYKLGNIEMAAERFQSAIQHFEQGYGLCISSDTNAETVYAYLCANQLCILFKYKIHDNEKASFWNERANKIEPNDKK